MWYGSLPPVVKHMQVPPYILLYAESDDGLKWHKPLMDIVPDGDHAMTNIVYRGQHGNCSAFEIVVDQRETDANRRHKMIYKGGRDSEGVSAEELAFSADGLKWRAYEGNPVMPYRHDCNLNLLFDASRQRWRAYLRPYVFGSGLWPSATVGVHHRRRVAMCESRDLIEWTKIRTVLGPNEGDENEFDNIAIVPCGGTLVGFLGTFEENERHEQRQHVQLALSIDGVSWELVAGAGDYLSPTGLEGDFDRDSVGVSTAGITGGASDPEELWLYYQGSRWTTGSFDGESSIGILRVRGRRFAEQFAADEGWLVTRELVFNGNRLTVDARADGELAVELAEYPGQPIQGFSVNDCDPIRGDSSAHQIAWGGNPDLNALRGRPLYVRFRLRNAGIWAFTVHDGDVQR